MTTRPGFSAVERLRWERCKTLARCMCVTLPRRSLLATGPTRIYVTDHDKPITTGFDGQTYLPVTAGSLSADRREGGLRAGDQEVRGIIDGVVVTPTMVSRRLLVGAKVREVLVDWQQPWGNGIFAAHTKWIREITWSGSTWVGKLTGRAEMLQRQSGGRFGGIWAPTCGYTLGDEATCKYVLVAGSDRKQFGFAVDAVTNSGRFTATSTSMSGLAVGWLRHGSVEFLWSAPIDSGTTTATTTLTTVTDSSQSWTVNEHAGRFVRILTGTGGRVQNASYARIVSNTSTVLTHETIDQTYASPVAYDIAPEIDRNVGVQGHVVAFTGSPGNDITLLMRMPEDIEPGDSGLWITGCDGLLSTCDSKFSNNENHGGDPFAPSAQQLLQQPDDR